MKMYRIRALVIRHLILTFRDFHRFIDFLYWPILDIITWGFTSRWIQETQQSTVQLSFILLTALIFWQVLMRAQIEVSFSFLDELWSNNFTNLFSTPIKLSEWIVAVMFIGVCKCIFAFLFSSLVIYLIYGIGIFKLGSMVLYFLILMILSGWVIGFLTTSAVAYWGQKVQTLTWVMGWFFAPFSGVFYPTSILPHWAQAVSRLLPMSYLFDGIRLATTTGQFPSQSLFISAVLNCFYLTLAILLFKRAFKQSKIYGLARLERYE